MYLKMLFIDQCYYTVIGAIVERDFLQKRYEECLAFKHLPVVQSIEQRLWILSIITYHIDFIISAVVLSGRFTWVNILLFLFFINCVLGLNSGKMGESLY